MSQRTSNSTKKFQLIQQKNIAITCNHELQSEVRLKSKPKT